HAENTKLAHITNNLTAAYRHWEATCAEAPHPQLYSRNHELEAERCCLDAYVDTRIKLPEDGRWARGSPRVATYPWATTRDSIGPTLSNVPRGQENMDRSVYLQFNANTKTPFNKCLGGGTCVTSRQWRTCR
ncbi:hypothetical protein PMIN01_09676, partial [Paraphaeosphaeria minitans]